LEQAAQGRGGVTSLEVFTKTCRYGTSGCGLIGMVGGDDLMVGLDDLRGLFQP